MVRGGGGILKILLSGLFRIANDCLDVKIWSYKYYTTNLPYRNESEGGIVWFYVRISLATTCFLYSW